MNERLKWPKKKTNWTKKDALSNKNENKMGFGSEHENNEESSERREIILILKNNTINRYIIVYLYLIYFFNSE